MDVEDETLKDILTCVTNKLGIEKWHYQRKKTKVGGLNYLGNLIPVMLANESSGEVIHLVIKRAPHQVPELEECISIVYNKEVYVYNMLMPIFKSLDTGINYDKLFPKCYYADSSLENRLLVLNDMRTEGFVSFTGKYLDIDHTNVSLKTIAAYHTLSIILSEKKIKPLNNHMLRPFMSNDPAFYYSSVKHCVQKYYNILFKNTIHSNFLVNLIDNFANYMDDSSSKAKRLVYGHGDFWKENILFEYMNKKPVGACLVDYQITRLMSPAQDVLFLLMNGVNSSTRRQHFMSFISTYYNELHSILCSNGLDPRIVYPVEDFHHDLKLVFPFCFIMGFISFVLWLGFEGLDNILNKTEKNIPHKQRKKIEERLKKKIEVLIADFRDLGYIDDLTECVTNN